MRASTHRLSIEGTRLLLDGAPFHYQGVSFFNALYNRNFNRDDEARARWLQVFRERGVSVVRVWCQWDFTGKHGGFIDLAPEHTIYADDGTVRDEPFSALVALIEAADRLGMLVEVCLFSGEKDTNLPAAALERGARQMTERLRPARNILLQVWNEKSVEILRLVDAVKSTDSTRIVTSSPGWAGVLGDEAQNGALDLLTPHTSRSANHPSGLPWWELGPMQIAWLLCRYRKPVIDDEPARCGTLDFGGMPGGTDPRQHIAQIRAVRALGGYHLYHHDMFQCGYGHPSIPPSGIPEPEFSPHHRQVFAFLRDEPRWENPGVVDEPRCRELAEAYDRVLRKLAERKG